MNQVELSKKQKDKLKEIKNKFFEKIQKKQYGFTDSKGNDVFNISARQIQTIDMLDRLG